MNWDAISFDWNHVRAFLAVVEQGSFSAAARALRQTQPTLSRQIGALEASLEVSLFKRGTREMALTVSGIELLDHVRTMADAAAHISRVAAGQNQTVEGTVRISSTDAMAAYVLPQCLVELQRVHPGIKIELVLSSDLSDLTRREADIAIRHVRPDQPDLIAKRIAEVDVALFASASYAQELGQPITTEKVAAARFIGFEHPERLIAPINHMGVPVSCENFHVTTSNGVTLYELTKMGLGITLLPVLIARDVMGLSQILPELTPAKLPIWLVAHRDVHTNLRIRLTFDLLAQELSKYRRL